MKRPSSPKSGGLVTPTARTISFIMVLFAVVLVFPLSVSYAIAAAYNASDVLGQTFGATAPNFTGNQTNNTSGADGFSYPVPATLDTVYHRFFVADCSNNRVMVFNLDSSNNLIDHTADNVLGQLNFTGNASATTQSGLLCPYGLAFDSTNNFLFVSDLGNNRVLVFDTTTISNGMNASNVLGQANFTSSGTGTTQSTMNFPDGIAFDNTNGRLYLTDNSNNRVLVFDTTTITNGMNASNVLGQANFTSGGAATTQSGMNRPLDVTYDNAGNRLFVAEDGNNRVLVFDTTNISNGMNASNVLGQANFTSSGTGTTQSGMGNPIGLEFDSVANRLFVGDQSNNRVLVFDTTTITNGMNASNVLGQANFTSGGSATTQSGLNDPEVGLSFDSGNNRLYVTDSSNNRIMIFDVAAITNGENAVDVLGQTDALGNPSYITASVLNAHINNSGFNTPDGIALDNVNHRLFVIDNSNHRVLVFNLDSSNNLIDHTADFVLGQPDFASSAGAATQSGMYYPDGLAFDSLHNRLFVADAGNTRALVFDTTTITNGMNASFVLGQPNFTSNATATTQSGMDRAFAVIYDAINDRLFVSDINNNRVLVFDTTTITNGMNASFVLGQANFTSGSASTTQSGMYTPIGLTYDATNSYLFVIDDSNHRVLVFDTTTITNGMNASFVLGQANFTSAVAATTQSGMYYPNSAEHDSTGHHLFLSDSGNNRVLVFDTASITNGMNAISVLGQTDFTSSVIATTQNGFSNYLALGLIFDSGNNRLYVSDASNNRVLIYDFVTLTTTSPLPAGTAGSSYSQALGTIASQGTVTTAVISGALPSGISLAGDSLTGTPTTAGAYTFTIQATDTTSVGTFLSPAVTYSLTIAAAPPASSGGGGGGTSVPPPVNPGLNPPANPLPYFPSYPVGTLINQRGTIYLITAPYVAVGFTTWPAFVGLGYQLRYVIQDNLFGYRIPTDYFLSSPTQSHPWTAWVLSGRTVYYVSPQGLIGVATWDVFLNNGGQAKYILPANKNDLQVLKDHPNLPLLQPNDPRVVR
jgi:DNA-binding beta-propeller fold protein YncE